MNLKSVEFELNKMRAETLGENGKKLQLLSGMILKEQEYLSRAKKINARLDSMLAEKKLGRKKRRLLEAIRDRIAKKTERSAAYLAQMIARRTEIYQNLILQREALGVTDHSWIDEYYMKHGQEK